MYQHVVKLATSFASQYREIATLTSDDNKLIMTIVNHKSPYLNRVYICEDVTNKHSRLSFASTLMELYGIFEKERAESIRHGFSVALQHMKESVLQALHQMSADEIKGLVDAEIQKRKTSYENRNQGSEGTGSASKA